MGKKQKKKIYSLESLKQHRAVSPSHVMASVGTLRPLFHISALRTQAEGASSTGSLFCLFRVRHAVIHPLAVHAGVTVTVPHIAWASASLKAISSLEAEGRAILPST